MFKEGLVKDLVVNSIIIDQEQEAIGKIKFINKIYEKEDEA